MDISDKRWASMSDSVILKLLGEFVRHHRLEQNKPQAQLAEEAGINRSTLSEFERGTRSNMITFIQLLRALDMLHVLEAFEIREEISPLKLAELEHHKRQRASGSDYNNRVEEPPTDW